MLYYPGIDGSVGNNINKTNNQKSAIFVTIGIFQVNGLSFKHMLAIVVMMYVLIMSMNLSDIAIVNIHGADYCCIISRISKSDAIN